MTDSVDNQVQEHRKKLQLTQQELADIVGVTRQTIISIEKGNYVPSVALSLKLAKAFNTSVEKIFLLSK